MRARFIEGMQEDFRRIIDDIFGIWDKWEDDKRRGINYDIERFLLSGKETLRFFFRDSCSDDFYVDAENYLKDYKIRNFGKFDAPFNWQWIGDQGLYIFLED
jgi:hypothetical protein